MSEPFTVVDEGEIEALVAFRRLSPPQRKAALKMGEQLVAGKPIRAVGLSFLIDCGIRREEAERLVATLPTQEKGDV